MIGRTESTDEYTSCASQHILVQLIRAAVPVTDLALMACQSQGAGGQEFTDQGLHALADGVRTSTWCPLRWTRSPMCCPVGARPRPRCKCT